MTATLAAPLSGGCSCARVRYRIVEEPIAFYACHCTECQRETGVSFGLTMLFRASALEHLSGEVRDVVATRPDGRTRRASLCIDCGVRVWAASSAPSVLRLAAGTLDEPQAWEPWGNMWTVRKHPWVALAPGPSFERQPEDPLFMVRAWHDRSLR